MKYIKKVLPFVILYVLFVISILFFVRINMDEVWNYGFSYAIRLGEIPYKDFNMVITPVYSLIMAIPLLISNNYVLMVLFHSLLLTITSYFVYKTYKEKGILLLLLSFIIYTVITPTYNSFIFMILLLLLYFESSKNKKKNFFINFNKTKYWIFYSNTYDLYRNKK
jgi:hypothetical protein